MGGIGNGNLENEYSVPCGLLFSLGRGQNQSFGPKQNTKFGVLSTTHPPTTHPPETFWRVLGIGGGQDLVCGLPIVQGTSAHSFDPPPPLTLSLVEGVTENFN